MKVALVARCLPIACPDLKKGVRSTSRNSISLPVRLVNIYINNGGSNLRLSFE